MSVVTGPVAPASGLEVRPTSADDQSGVLALYRRVAAVPGGLARLADEVDEAYVAGFLDRTLADGAGFVAVEGDRIVGEIHACRPGPFCFSHVLSELTIAVAPEAQGSGVGRRLFEEFLAEVRTNRPEVLRVELIARESNARAIAFYESLGFRREGRMDGRIRNLDGSFEADIPMAWSR